MKVKKSWIIQIIILVLFTYFLISLIPDQQVEKSEIILETGENSKEALDLKYDIIAQTVGEEFKLSKVGYINNKYLSELIVNKKISNRENSIAQELISMYEKNLSNEALNLSQELIEPILDNFDSKKTRKWTNYQFYFKKDNISFDFYSQKSILKEFNQSEITGNYTFVVKPYLYERYSFLMENGTVEVVDINLLTFEGEEELSHYIDITNYEPKVDFKEIHSQFIEAEQEYEFYFLIWS